MVGGPALLMQHKLQPIHPPASRAHLLIVVQCNQLLDHQLHHPMTGLEDKHCPLVSQYSLPQPTRISLITIENIHLLFIMYIQNKLYTPLQHLTLQDAGCLDCPR